MLTGAALLVLGLSPAVLSGQCTPECGEGLACKVVGSAGYPGCKCFGQPECECPPVPQPDYGCGPKACDSDADCGASGTYKCIDQKAECIHVSVLCKPDTSCPEVAQPDCPASTKVCQPPWELPCKVDADCGSGFSCYTVAVPCGVPMSVVDASGAEDVGCPDELYSQCRPKLMACDAATPCPTLWSCQTIKTTTPCQSLPSGQKECITLAAGQGLCTAPGGFLPTGTANGIPTSGADVASFEAADVGSLALPKSAPADGGSSSGSAGCQSSSSAATGMGLTLLLFAAIIWPSHRRTRLANGL